MVGGFFATQKRSSLEDRFFWNGGRKMQRFAPMVAIDVATKAVAVDLFDQLETATPKPIVKLGMELYYTAGPDIIRLARQRGFKVFLDLKLYDIPNTVGRAMKGLGKLGVSFVTVHAAGGKEMLQAALDGLEAGASAVNLPLPNLLAITELTSINQQIMNEEQGIPGELVTTVQRYAKLADEVGLAGVVCSAQEVTAIRQVTSAGFYCVTPGIRPVGSAKGDQKRVVTPAQAHQLGANAIVCGRPITQAESVRDAYEAIAKEFLEG